MTVNPCAHNVVVTSWGGEVVGASVAIVGSQKLSIERAARCGRNPANIDTKLGAVPSWPIEIIES